MPTAQYTLSFGTPKICLDACLKRPSLFWWRHQNPSCRWPIMCRAVVYRTGALLLLSRSRCFLHDHDLPLPPPPLPFPHPRSDHNPCALPLSGKNSSLGNSNSSGNSSNGNKSIWGRSIERDPGYRSGASAPPVPPPPPLPPLPPPEANDCSPRERERSRARMPAPPVVFGPAPNPSNPHHSATNNTGRDGEELEEEEEGFFCRVCGERVKSVSEEQHGTSTLHIFNQKHRPQERKVSQQEFLYVEIEGASKQPFSERRRRRCR